MLALLRHPEQFALPRFDGPVQRSGRVALADVELADGQVIRAGQAALLLIGAANRDAGPAASDAASRLASRSVGGRDPAGATGGASPLARLVQRLHGLRVLDYTLVRRPTLTLRCLASLPLDAHVESALGVRLALGAAARADLAVIVLDSRAPPNAARSACLPGHLGAGAVSSASTTCRAAGGPAVGAGSRSPRSPWHDPPRPTPHPPRCSSHSGRHG
jgi:hypothetical protein